MKPFKLFVLFFFVGFSCFSQTSLSRALKDKVVLTQSPILLKQLQEKDLKLGNPIFIRIIKETEEQDFGVLEMWVQGNGVDTFSLFKTYPICYFSGGLGTKNYEGDGKTPEGFYYVTKSRLKQYSSFHRAFNIGYPNAYDKSKAYTGNYIMIHGACCSIGCVAMTNEYIDEIWTMGIKALAGGQSFFRVHMFPFYMTDENMKIYSDYDYQDFWQNLRQGYNFFEENKFPPNVTVKNKKYLFK